ncbi:uncharacterized protein MONBRDRAFT_31409 [Monosiga brevicollis MX1]|uniref:Uncharacterized protein n=1 Tax=Monosiga brevicollis TaxID=81824 RepID=A9UT03_MONBE|nr:uncharacterized protein MONBRDRAFT_31409 [Monosiga brevicollis MX1]EDQ91411.1 predicted protein [Monosiga brevicollis MX1]|eukprot:XP_001743833.1 hypothetical protein [Monosiga brevicollis MX1]
MEQRRDAAHAASAGPSGRVRLADRSGYQLPFDRRTVKERIAKLRSRREIRDFQQHHTVPLLEPAWPMLRLLNIPRAEMNRAVLAHAKELFASRIPSMSTKQLTDTLKLCWPFALTEEIQPLVVQLLNQNAELEPSYLEELQNHPTLLEQCNLNVKQQLWVAKPGAFTAVAGPFLRQAALRLNQRCLLPVLFDRLFDNPFADLDEEATSEISELLQLVGSKMKLYEALLVELRSQFVKHGEPAYGCLRLRLSHGLTRAGADAIASKDPCSRFATLLTMVCQDAAISDQMYTDLEAALTSLAQEPTALLDVGLMLLHPHLAWTFAQIAVSRLESNITACKLPRHDEQLRILLQLLHCSNNLRAVLSRTKHVVPELTRSIVQDHVAAIANMLAEDAIAHRKEIIDSPADHRGTDNPKALRHAVDGNFSLQLILQRVACLAMSEGDLTRPLYIYHWFLMHQTQFPVALNYAAAGFMCNTLLQNWERTVKRLPEVFDKLLYRQARRHWKLHQLSADVFARLPQLEQIADSLNMILKMAQEGETPRHEDNPDYAHQCKQLLQTYLVSTESFDEKLQQTILVSLVKRFEGDVQIQLAKEFDVEVNEAAEQGEAPHNSDEAAHDENMESDADTALENDDQGEEVDEEEEGVQEDVDEEHVESEEAMDDEVDE